MNENNVERIAKILAEDHGDPQAWGAYASKAMQIIEIALSDDEEEDQGEVFRANGSPV